MPRVYEQYRPDYAVNRTNPHLHNVPLQIAAERPSCTVAGFTPRPGWWVVHVQIERAAGRDSVTFNVVVRPARGAGRSRRS